MTKQWIRARRAICACLLLMLCVGVGGCRKDEEGKEPDDGFTFDVREDYVLMSYNIKTQNGSTLEPVPKRAAALCDLLRRIQPDVVGLQEATNLWRDNIMAKGSFSALHYAMVGRENDTEGGSNDGWGTPILYRKDRFEMLESEIFWLSDTPDTESVGFGAKYGRSCTWVRLKDRTTGQEFVFINTHLDTREVARTPEFEMIREKAESFGDVPIVLTGDFNLRQDTELYETIRESLFEDSKKVAANIADGLSSKVDEHNKKTDDKPIDFVFVSGHWNVREYNLDIGEYMMQVTDTFSIETNISDHCAVYIHATPGSAANGI